MHTEQWALTITTPVGPQHVTLHLRHIARKWEGDVTSNDQTMSLSDIVHDGNHVTWTQHLTRPIQLTLQFDVTIVGMQMTGKARAGLLLTSNVSGTRTS